MKKSLPGSTYNNVAKILSPHINGSGKLTALFKEALFAAAFFLLMQSQVFAQITLTISKSNNAPNPVASGQPFTYTLTYSWSGGAPGTLYITDNVPSQLDVLSALPGSPTSNITGNQVTFSISGLTLPSGSGTVQINARFKPGVTCGGVKVCNRAAITTNPNGGQYVFSNDDCVTSANPTNKWTFEKEWIAGCAVDDQVTFRIKIINPSGGDIGGLNLTNVSLYDIVPAGAQILSVSGNWPTFSGTQLTGGPNTLYVSPWTIWYVAYVTVKFPSPTFVPNQQVVNTAQMTFNTPCSSQLITWSDTAKVTLCQGTTSGALNKWLTLNMSLPSNPSWYPVFSPGCCGTYNLYYTNNGTLGQTSFVMEDLIPTKTQVNTVRTTVPAGNVPVTVDLYCWSGSSCGTSPCSTVVYNTAGFPTLNVTQTNVCRVKWTYSGTVAVSQTLYNNMDVCVRSNDLATGAPVLPGQNIINTVTATATNLPTLTVTHTKTVDSTKPKIVTTKLFTGGCNNACQVNPNGPFQPGDTVRFRMAVANIGNANATTCSISDILPSGLSYVGNETYFYGSFNWMANIYNPPCCSLNVTVPPSIGGSITKPTVGATNLTWTFPVLPARCDGLVDYFIIDFDVKISDNPPAPPGQYVNTFTYSASNVPAVPSNQAFLTVNATAQLQAIKEVRKQGSGGPWSFSTSLTPGGIAEYRARVKNTGNTQLTNLCLLDIMPYTSDIKVLPAYSSRGSLFDMPYDPVNGAITITPTGFATTYNTVGLPQSKNPQRSTVCGGFCGVTDPGGAVAGTFTGTSAQTFSFKVNANTGVNLSPGGTLDIIIPAKVPGSGVQAQMNACNSFAVQAVPSGMPSICLSAESNNACVTVAQPEPCMRILEQKLNCVGKDANGNWVYQLAFTITNLTGAPANIQINAIPGSVVNINPGVIPNNTPTNVTASYISTTSQGQVCFGIILTPVGQHEGQICDSTFCLDLKPCPEPCPCPFKIDISNTGASQASGNQVWVTNNLTVSTPIMKVRATIVSATVTQTCFFGGTTTYSPAATIVSSNLNLATAIGYGTNEVTWTNMLCPTITNQPLNMYLNIPTAPGKGCFQKITICIRYTITDCKCNTCDTLVCYELTRKWSPIINPVDLGNNGLPPFRQKVKKGDIDEIQVNDSPFASMKMSSTTKGTLTIANPPEDIYTIGTTLRSVLLTSSPGVRAISLKPDNAAWSQGVQTDTGIVSYGSLEPGKTLNFDVEFENNQSFRTWINTLLFTYTLPDLPDTLSGTVQVTSRTPGTSGGDTLTTDFNSSQVVRNARTYALRFLNANITKDSIATLVLRLNSGQILAVGPALGTNEVTLSGYRIRGGNIILLAGAPGQDQAVLSAIPAGSDIGPIYITISADSGQSVILQYSTLTGSSDTISAGSIELTAPPVLGVKGDGDIELKDIYLSDARPNPANNSTTIRFRLNNDEQSVTLTLTDIRGTQAAVLIDSAPMSAGDHEAILNTESLPSGVYYYTLKASGSSQTRRLVIIK